LERLVALLDAAERWDRELSEDEQQALAFARAVLHKSPWLIVDEVIDTLDEDALKRVTDILSKDLAKTGVINIGRVDPQHIFPRVVHLVKDPAARLATASGPATPLSAPALSK
jgi:putative ATP-binding cassette transporter